RPVGRPVSRAPSEPAEEDRTPMPADPSDYSAEPTPPNPTYGRLAFAALAVVAVVGIGLAFYFASERSEARRAHAGLQAEFDDRVAGVVAERDAAVDQLAALRGQVEEEARLRAEIE